RDRHARHPAGGPGQGEGGEVRGLNGRSKRRTSWCPRRAWAPVPAPLVPTGSTNRRLHMRIPPTLVFGAILLAPPVNLPGDAAPQLTRTTRSGPWSAPATWEGGKVPAGGDRVQIRAGDRVTYDLNDSPRIRSVHVAGTLTFAHDRDTRLDVGLI